MAAWARFTRGETSPRFFFEQEQLTGFPPARHALIHPVKPFYYNPFFLGRAVPCATWRY